VTLLTKQVWGVFIVWLLSHAPEKTSKMGICVKVSMLCKVLAQSIDIPSKKHGMHNSSKVFLITGRYTTAKRWQRSVNGGNKEWDSVSVVL